MAGRSVVLKKDIWDFPKWMEMPENLEWWSNEDVETFGAWKSMTSPFCSVFEDTGAPGGTEWLEV